ncbi:MAG: alpha-2-macroglobulin [Bacteroidales bacterium]|nr:alpha-2-macroglobulin [Bacteroidales bacterium]
MKLSKLISCVILASVFMAGCNQGTGNAPSVKTDENGIQSVSADPVQQTPEEAGYLSYGSEPSGEPTPEAPCIKLISKGSVLPSIGKMDLLFSSYGYTQARFRVRKIFTSNILQFMQFDSYDARYELFKVARVVADTTVILGRTDAPHLRELRNYGISLDELIKPEPGAIYYVEIRGLEPLEEEDFWDSDSYFGDYETYEDRNTFLVASDLALIAKCADNKCEVFACDILSGQPLKGVRVKFYDDVLQEIGKGVTDKDGLVTFPGNSDGRYVMANSDKGAAYLALKNEKSLSTSNFDVSGSTGNGKFKAYIFGERGVWRPGDTIHVTMITMAEDEDLPAGHPVVAELRNPDGQVTSTVTVKNDGGHIYHFPFSTEADAPTGRWYVNVKVGGQSFGKSLRIETVKPNKLDINLAFEDKLLVPKSSCVGTLTVKWLYGAPGSGLKVNGDVELTNARTAFKGYEDYDFIDESRSFTSQSRYYSDMRTDENGQVSLSTNMNLREEGIPGMLNINFVMRAFEPSGEFSTGVSSFKMSPFDTYVGMKVEKDRSSWGEEYLKAGKSHKFDIVTVGPDGNPATVSDLHVQVCHVDWSWWWNSSSLIASYMSGSSKEIVLDKHIATRSGSGSFTYDWADAPDGLYFIQVSDETGGHASSMLCEVYENYSSAAQGSDAAVKLSINANKDKYNVGETARLVIPSSKGSRALVSLEKGGRILSSEWVECAAGSTEIKIPVNNTMLPNVYAFITLVQPHAETLNDAPIRMYGVCNLNVEDEASHLQPVIDIPAEVKPESEISFKVKEKNGKAMSYVVALVDEGLLGLTGFKTPDAWKAFYAKEALRVRTWDLYDDVIGAYGGKIEQLFAIGGDDEGAESVMKPQNAQRFKAVVSYLGPFTLKAGKTATHKAEIPQYIGSLRAMVIATDGHAQGNCESNVAVTKPVMVQATLPRAMNIGETIKVPVTVFTMKDGIGEVKVGIKASELLEVVGPDKQSVNSAKAGNEVCYFTLKVKDNTGVARVSVNAEGAGDKSAHDIEIDVNNPNPEVTRSSTVLLAAGESKTVDVDLFGTPGTNSAEIELSTIPAIDLGSRLRYLTGYPYGCLEQTVSSVFPQLYLDKVMSRDENSRKRSRINIESAIRRLQNYRRSDGSLSYWPGQSQSSLFGSAYALHFLKEAEDQGYAVPVDLKKELIAWLGKTVSDSKQDFTSRAYGVYALAVAGKPQRSAMNLLREKVKKMPASAAWLLAAAYAVDGKKNVAKEISAPLQYEDKTYEAYGSSDRNRAVALKLMLLTGRKEEAFRLASELAGRLNDKNVWMSTQSSAWSLYAVCDYARANAGGVQASVTAGGKASKFDNGKCIESSSLPVEASARKLSVKLENSGQGNLYAVASVTGIPAASEEKAVSKGLKMTVSYQDEDRNAIKVDTLSRGRTIYAVVTVTNPGAAAVRDIALNHKFPSGWEIQNERLYSESVSYPSGVSYQDIRDDRVYSFFDLGAGSSVVIRTKLVATYPGRFYLPAVSCSAMYDASVTALVPGRWVEVK